MATIMEARGLKKYFKTRSGLLHAVDDVNFSIEQGTTLGVVGESGCGKSTLGRLLVHLLEATEGQILFDGRDVTSVDRRQLIELRNDVQLVFQDPYSSLNARMMVYETIAEPLVIQGRLKKPEINARVEQLMETVGLDRRFMNAYPHEMDGGRRQRVGIARALALEPRFIAGQSAGAGTVLAMTVSPLAEGLFQKGIVQSGFILGEHSNCNPPPLKDAEQYGLQYMREVGCANLDEMLRLPPEKLCFDDGMMIGRPFLPVNDGIAMKEAFYKTISEGRHRDALYLYGNTSEEMGMEPGKRKLLMADALAFAKAQEALGKKTWLYCFSRRLPTVDNVGAAHAAELWYEYGAMSRSHLPFNGGDYQVSLNLIAYWANFMRGGDPNGDGLPQWRPYCTEKPEFMEINDNLGMRRVTQ